MQYPYLYILGMVHYPNGVRFSSCIIGGKLTWFFFLINDSILSLSTMSSFVFTQTFSVIAQTCLRQELLLRRAILPMASCSMLKYMCIFNLLMVSKKIILYSYNGGTFTNIQIFANAYAVNIILAIYELAIVFFFSWVILK